jgi:dihydroxy-acid dehydratase
VREAIRAAGGIAMEFPVHPIQETGKRPTAALDRNLAYLGLVEVLYGYPLDGVVLTTGCDKTMPACIMAAATVNIPAIVLSGGPMLNGWHRGERTGSGTIVWKARELLAEGKIDYEGFMELVASSASSVGHCNTMGTATTMNSLAEALGMSLPGCAAIPGPYRERGQIAYETGTRIVEMVREDLKPSDILTREAFENAIVVNSAIGGSTNAPIHINAIARHVGVELDQGVGDHRPCGAAAGEPAAGGKVPRRGVPPRRRRPRRGRRADEARADPRERAHRQRPDDRRQLPRPRDHRCRRDPQLRNRAGARRRLHRARRQPVRFGHHEDQRDLGGVPRRYLSNPDDPEAFEGPAVVFDGPEDYHARIDDPSSASTRRRCCSCAGPGRSAIRARPKWSTCTRRRRS